MNSTGHRPINVSTHLREVAYCDVIKRQMTPLLTLSGDIRRRLTFKENKGIFLAFWIKIYFFSQQDAVHVAGDHTRTFLSCMELSTSSSIIFVIIADCNKQRTISVYEDTNVHLLIEKCGLQVFP